MIDDSVIDKALNWLSSNAHAASKARAERIYLENYTKHLIAKLTRESDASSVSAQEKEAYASQKYLDHLEALKEAIEMDEYLRWMQSAAEVKIEAWRSEQANRRAAERVV